MNVLCEVSLLGFCGDDAAKITGMPRAICELSARLGRSPALEIAFCATEERTRTFEFLRRHPAFEGAQIALESQSETEIPPRAAQNAQIFHTTHAPVPASARDFPHLAIVQTIYDMIPFTMPETLPESYGVYYRDIVARLRPTDTIITISQSAKNDICDIAKFDPNRVHITPLAADKNQFYPVRDAKKRGQIRANYQIPDAPYLLSVCTFEPRKNLRQTVRAFVKLLEEQPELEINLVLAGGNGWKFEPILSEIAGASRFKDRIIVTGYVAETDLAALYSGALAFVYPSLYEGFGLPPLEAMSCGVPVICSNGSSLPEVVGDAGILLDPTDLDALCAAMLEMSLNSGRREELSAQSLARAGHFSWEKCAEATIRAYEAARSSC